jgi:Actinobacteria/chloroflexi VLRF1 release factor
VKNGAGSGGKWLDVSAERFPGWIASFSVRHGLSAADGAPGAAGVPESGQWPGGAGAALTVTFGDDRASFTAEDGSVAECYPPFPPPGGASMLAATAGADSAADPASPATPADVAAIAAAFAAHARRPRTVGVLLVRLGGYAAGVFTGYPPALQDAKVGSRLVHGRSAAGGWSQHRFARRREKQANEALDAAADAAVLIFGKRDVKGQITARSGGAAANRGVAANRGAAANRGVAPVGQPPVTRLDAVVLGGDRRAVAELRDDPRLAPYFTLAAERFLTVPDPKRAVLLETPRLFTAVRIRLTEA